jgi:hypothetical protein
MHDPSKIAQQINTIDTFHEMSDSNVKWELEHRKCTSIEAQLRNMSPLQRITIKDRLTTVGKTNYQRYFSKY